MAADVNLIEMALSSRTELIGLIFGGGGGKKATKDEMVARFKEFAATHNRSRGKKRG